MFEKKVLTPHEIAEVLGLSYRGACALARRGALPGVFRIGRRYYIPKSALEELLRCRIGISETREEAEKEGG